MIKHEAREIQINIKFENPKLISKGIELDELEVEIIQPEVFISQKTGRPVELQFMEGRKVHFIQKIQ